jgi:hypothetical protein
VDPFYSAGYSTRQTVDPLYSAGYSARQTVDPLPQRRIQRMADCGSVVTAHGYSARQTGSVATASDTAHGRLRIRCHSPGDSARETVHPLCSAGYSAWQTAVAKVPNIKTNERPLQQAATYGCETRSTNKKDNADVLSANYSETLSFIPTPQKK